MNWQGTWIRFLFGKTITVYIFKPQFGIREDCGYFDRWRCASGIFLTLAPGQSNVERPENDETAILLIKSEN